MLAIVHFQKNVYIVYNEGPWMAEHCFSNGEAHSPHIDVAQVNPALSL